MGLKCEMFMIFNKIFIYILLKLNMTAKQRILKAS